MPKDISNILEGWEFDPDGFCVRLIMGDDGREKIQLRLDLGLLQLEVDGRPDGVRPEGCEAWLEFYQREQQLRESSGGPALELDSSDCARLLREGVQYYHRYLSFWHLGRYELCARDTARNLRLFAFVREFAKSDRDKLQFDQWRPYVIMMHARAVATPLVELGDFEAALRVIDAGVAGIWKFLAEYKQESRAEECAELTQLKRWREQVVAQQAQVAEDRPDDPLEALRRKLAEAVVAERFEEAAQLRDEIRRLEAARR